MSVAALLVVASLAISAAAVAKGPTGLGTIKLGMSKEEIEAIPASEDVRLEGTMTPYQYKNQAPKPGVEKFDAALVTPLTTAPLKAVLTFEEGRLTGLYVSIDDASGLLERLAKHISERYGPGKVEDSRKEEQCIYKNGANFKLTSGVVRTQWTEEAGTTERIETSLSDIVVDVCPSNLRYGGIGAVKLKSLNIQKVKSAQEPKSKNLF